MRFFSRGRANDPAQLPLPFDGPPRDAVALYDRLVKLGLRGYSQVVLTSNATVMVSFAPGVLRVHRGYLEASEAVHRAIVTFACARRRRDRAAARRIIVEHAPAVPRGRRRRREPLHPNDHPLAAELSLWHRRYNDQHFGGSLTEIAIRVSRRMRARLGQYASATPGGESAEISISSSHIRRHGWEEALHTLLHEMVHQWQAENGHPLDHGRLFRQKAREVGIAASAAREVGGGRGGCQIPGGALERPEPALITGRMDAPGAPAQNELTRSASEGLSHQRFDDAEARFPPSSK